MPPAADGPPSILPPHRLDLVRDDPQPFTHGRHGLDGIDLQFLRGGQHVPVSLRIEAERLHAPFDLVDPAPPPFRARRQQGDAERLGEFRPYVPGAPQQGRMIGVELLDRRFHGRRDHAGGD